MFPAVMVRSQRPANGSDACFCERAGTSIAAPKISTNQNCFITAPVYPTKNRPDSGALSFVQDGRQQVAKPHAHQTKHYRADDVRAGFEPFAIASEIEGFQAEGRKSCIA